MQKKAALIIVAFLLGTIFSAAVSFDTLEENPIPYNSGITNSSWTNVTIDSSGSVGRHTSLVVDSQDNIHISYYDADNKDLKYARFDGNQWNHTTVAGSAADSNVGMDDYGMYSSIALNSSDGVHIAYYDESNGALNLAVKYGNPSLVSTEWHHTVVDGSDSLNQVGRPLSLAIDSGDKIHFAYKNSSDASLKYTSCRSVYECYGLMSPPTWYQAQAPVKVAEFDGYGLDIAIGTNDQIHIVYDDNNSLNQASYDQINNSWSISESPTEGTPNTISVDIDSGDYLHVTYHSYANEQNDIVYTKYSKSSGWGSNFTVESEQQAGCGIPSYPSIALDSDELPIISYACDIVPGLQLWVAEFDEVMSPQRYLVDEYPYPDTNGVGQYSHIGIDSVNGIHISYHDLSNANLKYAHLVGTGSNNQNPNTELSNWTVSPSTGPSEGGTELTISGNGFSSLLVDEEISELPEIINRTWTNSTMDDLGGSFSSTDVDLHGNLHIAYYNESSGDIRYVLYDGQSVTKSLVDNIGIGTVGVGTSIKVDDQGGVHISYARLTNGNLAYAYWNGTNYGTGAPISWTTVDVDSSGFIGYWPSVSLHNGNVDIVYEDIDNKAIKLATCIAGANCFNANEWSISRIAGNQTLDALPGIDKSMDVDSNGNLHVSYWDYTNNNLKYATNSSSQWINQTIDSAGDVGSQSSIVVDSQDNIHISYYDTSNEGLKYAYFDGNSWSISAIDNVGDSTFTSIDVDSKNNPHIAYTEVSSNQNNNLKYATNENGIWEKFSLDGSWASDLDVGAYCSLSVDANDEVHISYEDTDGQLKYIVSTISLNSPWLDEVVDSNGEIRSEVSVGIDQSANIHVAYHDYTSNSLKYAYKENNSWTISVVDSSTVSPGYGMSYNSLAIDSTGAIHIVYGDTDSDVLRHARKNSTASNFYIQNIFTGTGPFPPYHSLAIDSNDIPHVSMVGWSGANLKQKYATVVNGTWVASDVANLDGAGGHSYLALDSNNSPHIIFKDYSTSTPTIKHATNLGSVSSQNWQITTVVSSFTNYFDIVIDSLDNIHICYSTGFSEFSNMKYATKTNGNWTNEVVDEYGSVGWDVDCAMNQLGQIEIVYEDKSENEIKRAKKVGNNWEIVGITNVAWGSDTSIDIDSNGNVAVAYSDYPDNDLHVVTYSPTTTNTSSELSTWSNTTIGFDMSHVSAILDGNGKAHLSYYDSLNEDLMYATNKNGTWQNYTIDSSGDVGRFPSIAIDSNGTVHFSYLTSSAGLKYANFDNFGTAEIYEIDFGTTPTMTFSKIHVDSRNMPHIVYYDSANGELRHVTRPNFGTSWNDSLVYLLQNVSNLEVELDSMNDIHVIFNQEDYESMTAELTYVKKNLTNGWSYEYSSNSSNELGHNALTLGLNDDVHILYRDVPENSWYVYIQNNSTDIIEFNLTNVNDDANHFDIEIDSLNRSHITYNSEDIFGFEQGPIYRVIDPLGFSSSYTIMENQCRHLELDSDDNIHCFFSNSSGWHHSVKFGDSQNGTNDQLNVQFGDYGNVTGTVVNDTTIIVNTPPGLTGDTVDLTLWADNGSGYVLTSAFTYLPDSNPDLDGDGIDNELDDCPDSAGNSTIDQIGCPDSDGDGYSDSGDLFPSDSSEWADSDGDGVGNNGDAFPTDYNETQDSDGDGVGNNGDAFPTDYNETQDSDGDGVGDNSDAFPNNGGESIDTDGDGVGDNSDEFPDDANETQDSDGDGIGDNGDEYPFLNNYNDSDGDSFFDLEDDFPNDPTQWSDYDGDGHGDNPEGNDPDLFINNVTQWSDADGDGFGDNWGNPEWNATRLFIWPGQFVEGAELADHCPTQFGNSSADGFFGCPDDDKDGIANIYDEIDNSQNQTVDLDTDLDGISDSEDLCPDSTEGAFVDINGCLVDSDGDGIDDLQDKCPNSKIGAVINIEGCEIVEEKEEQPKSYTESLLAGETDAILKTVGAGAVIIAVLGFLQTNFVAALLPDAVKWMQFARRKSKLSKEEEQELLYLQSLVQAYYYDYQTISEELQQLKSELTARFTNNEIKQSTREKINILISDLLQMDDIEMKRIAHDDTYFGLAGTIDIKSRNELLEEELAMRSDIFDQPEPVVVASSVATTPAIPNRNIVGEINPADNYEYLEYPSGSGVWYLRNNSTGEWEKWSN